MALSVPLDLRFTPAVDCLAFALRRSGVASPPPCGLGYSAGSQPGHWSQHNHEETRRSFLLLAAVVAVPAWAQPPPHPRRPRRRSRNPLLKTWTTPFQVPPFQEIKPEHFLPAIKEALAEQRKEIDAIVNNPQPPTFENTIVALDQSGELLSKVQGVFGALQGAETNPELQTVNRETAPLISAARDEIRLNAKLFERVKAVYDERDDAEADARPEASWSRTPTRATSASGANLDAAKKERAEEDQRRVVGAGDQVRRQPAARHQRLPAGDRQAGGPEGPAALGHRVRARTPPRPRRCRASGSTRSRRRASGRSCSTRTTASCGGRSSRRTRAACDHNDQWDNKKTIAAHRGAARRALQPARLQELRRLRPRREHGEERRRACTAC